MTTTAPSNAAVETTNTKKAVASSALSLDPSSWTALNVMPYASTAIDSVLKVGQTAANPFALGNNILKTANVDLLSLTSVVTDGNLSVKATAGAGSNKEISKKDSAYAVTANANTASAESAQNRNEAIQENIDMGDAIAGGFVPLGALGTSSIYQGRDANGTVYIDSTSERQWSVSGGGKKNYNREQGLMDSTWDGEVAKGTKARLELTNTRSNSGKEEIEIEYEFILLGMSMSQSEDVQVFKAFNMHVINSFGSGVPVINMNMLLPHNKYKPWFGNMMEFYNNRAKSSVSVPKGYTCKLYLDNSWYEILPFGYSMDRDSSSKYNVSVTMQAFVLDSYIFNEVQKVIVQTSKNGEKNATNTLYQPMPAKYNTTNSWKDSFKSLLSPTNLISGLFKGFGF